MFLTSFDLLPGLVKTKKKKSGKRNSTSTTFYDQWSWKIKIEKKKVVGTALTASQYLLIESREEKKGEKKEEKKEEMKEEKKERLFSFRLRAISMKR